MNYTNILNNVADQFIQQINKSAGVGQIPTEDFGWDNYRFHSDVYRMAHVERYTDTKVDVLHVTTFPHHWSPEPIFGFDVITTDQKIIGCYMDFSPGIKTYPFDDGMHWKTRKPLPEWATVFSDRFILIQPDSDSEFENLCEWVLGKYKWYMEEILLNEEVADVFMVTEIQNNYCEVQSKNPRTYNVLKAKIGEEAAKYFMTEILFPKIY